MSREKTNDKPKRGIMHVIGNIIGILIIVVLLPIMVVNITLIVKSYTQPEKVPTFMGVAPLIVLSGSMEPTIQIDDLIFTKEIKAEDIKVNDVICFKPFDAENVVTHRVTAISQDKGITYYTTKGDANNVEDTDKVQGIQVVGKYFARIGGAGKVATFLQSPIGMVIFVAIPLALFLLYDLLRRIIYNKSKKKEVNAEKEELERLRALAAGLEAAPVAPVTESVAEPATEAAPAPAAEAAPEPAAESKPENEYPPLPGEDTVL